MWLQVWQDSCLPDFYFQIMLWVIVLRKKRLELTRDIIRTVNLTVDSSHLRRKILELAWDIVRTVNLTVDSSHLRRKILELAWDIVRTGTMPQKSGNLEGTLNLPDSKTLVATSDHFNSREFNASAPSSPNHRPWYVTILQTNPDYHTCCSALVSVMAKMSRRKWRIPTGNFKARGQLSQSSTLIWRITIPEMSCSGLESP